MEGVTGWSQFSPGLPGFHTERPVAQPAPQPQGSLAWLVTQETQEGVVCPQSQNPSQDVNPMI